MTVIWPVTGNKLITASPLANVIGYHHVGLGVSDLIKSKEFYAKLGFTDNGGDKDVVKHPNGMELHFIPATSTPDNQNLLMDFPESKEPGHTHLSFSVPNVAACQAFLKDEQKIDITGERVMGGALRAVFIRDPDRATIEFERNVGEMDKVGSFTSDMIGDDRPMDHVGTRVNDPKRCFIWYAEVLGFVNEVMHYSLDPDPLKNGRPFISRTEGGVDINLIPNGNQHGAPDYNHLIQNGKVLPGIVYVGYTVGDLNACKKRLGDGGIQFWEEDNAADLGLKPIHVNKLGSPSIFLRDPHGSLFRLVQDLN